MKRELYVKETGKAAVAGQTYMDFRGETWVLDDFKEPAHGGSTGRVYVHKPGVEDSSREFFPSVLGMEWKYPEDTVEVIDDQAVVDAVKDAMKHFNNWISLIENVGNQDAFSDRLLELAFEKARKAEEIHNKRLGGN